VPPAAPIVLFDDGLGQLGPLTELRPAFDVRTAARTTLERWRAAGATIAALLVPERLRAATIHAHRGLPVHAIAPDPANAPAGTRPGDADPPPPPPPPAGAVLVNGRWPLGCRHALALGDLPPGGGLINSDGALLAARPRSWASPAGAVALSPGAYDATGLDADDPAAGLLERPWSVRALRDACLAHDLADLSPMGSAAVHPQAQCAPTAVLDAAGGPIYVDRCARLGHHAVVLGPAYVGPGATVLEHALIRGGTAIGPVCKVGGEVGGTIFQGYANKAHEGYLGDSFVGQWANLGAGTTTSNLLNTYAPVAARPAADRPLERTGLVFLGAVLGDHVKTAIHTRVMAGASVGAGTMWAAAGPIAGAVGPARWVTDAGDSPYRRDKLLEVARAAMARRGHELDPPQADLLAALCLA